MVRITGKAVAKKMSAAGFKSIGSVAGAAIGAME